MLNKTAAHPILQHDADLKIFLESDAFNIDVKQREHKEPGLGESKGMFSSIGLGSSGSSKFIEHDDWFHDRKIYLDALENQLKALLKAIDTVVAQRKALAEAAGEFSASLHALSTVELSVTLSPPLEGLSDLQLRIRELYERQAQQDVLTLGITVDEYIRLISSIRMAFAQRQKSFHSWHAAEAELSKRKTTQEKMLRSGKTQQDRLNQLQADVADGERRCHQARLLFEDMGRLMRSELERFEKEKVEDFKSGVETFLEGAVEAQKEVSPFSKVFFSNYRAGLLPQYPSGFSLFNTHIYLTSHNPIAPLIHPRISCPQTHTNYNMPVNLQLIELWETFLMQLDADEDGEPFFRPPLITPSSPLLPPQQHDSRNVEPGGENERPHAAAATATVEQEE